MKLAIPYENGSAFPHFGRAAQFKIYRIENGTAEAETVLEAAGVSHEALAELLRDAGVTAVVCGGIGAGAEQALADAGLTLYSGVHGDADEAAAALAAGTLDSSTGATCDHHHEEAASGCGCGQNAAEGQSACGGGCCGSAGGCCGCAAPYVETRTFTEIVHLTAENFEEEVLRDPGLICIDFWATWCGPCKMMAPIFEAVNAEQPKVKFCKVNVDEQPELAKLFGIESIPTIVLIQNRRTLTGFVGAREKEDLTKLVESCLA